MALEVQRKALFPSVDSNGFYKDSDGVHWGDEVYCLSLFDSLTKEEFSNIYKFLPEQRTGTGRDGVRTSLYRLENLAQILKKDGKDVPETLAPKTEADHVKDLEKFSHDAEREQGFSSEEFGTLISLFGASNAVDILLRYKPEFQGIPIDKVRKILAEYLGEFLMRNRGTRVVKDLGKYLVFLDDERFRDNLFEVIKHECYGAYIQQKRKDSTRPDREIIDKHIEEILSESEEEGLLKNKHFNTIINEVIDFYTSLFDTFTKTDNLVDELRKDRQFPDINQLINYKEIKDKKRMLIADEMGLGKSASAVFAKEGLGIKTAIIVVPSNVTTTWQEYLSDTIGIDDAGNEKQIGYFKTGKTPHIVHVDGPEAIKNLTHAQPPDYVVISQEKLENDTYVDALMEMGFDMLIVDEAHKLKNVSSGVRAKNFLKLAEKIEGDDKYLILLSGTPIPNKVRDMAMHLMLLYPDKFSKMKPKELINDILHGEHVDLRSLLLRRMQMKNLAESIEMPKLDDHRPIMIQMSKDERYIYEDVLLAIDNIGAKEKMNLLQSFIMNPASLEATPEVPGTKLAALADHLREKMRTCSKIVVFTSILIEGIIRGNDSIPKQLASLLPGVRIIVLDGSIEQKDRQGIMDEFRNSNEKIIFFVSGQVADVGIDLSVGDHVIFYNEPWTEYDRRQQLGRVYRYGIKHDVEVDTLLVKGTIEEGIHRYIGMKYRAVEKLLRGIPLQKFEQNMLSKDDEDDSVLSEALAKHYQTVWEQMLAIFRVMPNIGEQEFIKFLSEETGNENNAERYARLYRELGSRNFHSNANRVAGTIIHHLASELSHDTKPEDLKILDVASGPEMLRKHIGNEYQNQVLSLDRNAEHFAGSDYFHHITGERAGSFLRMPLKDGQFDFVNMAVAFHYASYDPTEKENDFQRLELLCEINRVLRVGGKAVLTFLYSKDFKDDIEEKKFRSIVEVLGFRVVDAYSGVVQSGDRFMARLVTLEKVDASPSKTDIGTIVRALAPDRIESKKHAEHLTGLTMDSSLEDKQPKKLKNTLRIIEDFELNGERMDVHFNDRDRKISEEESMILTLGQQLRREYGSFENIPKNILLSREFGRMRPGKKWILFHKLESDSGIVVVEENDRAQVEYIEPEMEVESAA